MKPNHFALCVFTATEAIAPTGGDGRISQSKAREAQAAR
jgi:hypothetical protein